MPGVKPPKGTCRGPNKPLQALVQDLYEEFLGGERVDAARVHHHAHWDETCVRHEVAVVAVVT